MGQTSPLSSSRVGETSSIRATLATMPPGGAAVHHTGHLYVTGELTVRYVKGAPLEHPLLGRGHALLDSGKYLDLEATIEDWASGEIVAKATGRFFPMKPGSE